MVVHARRLDPKDGGLKSRKLLFGVATSAAMVATTLYAGDHPAIVPLLPTLFGSLMGVLGLYVSTNLVHKHLVSKEAPKAEPPAEQA